ncbi:hypothetical protein RvY_06625 [Ramazzottius varieornatus]|uniref:MARVEL domain-containing protein n=1 Tax=Ramazzottius varieornatus TaxID=947166 RepID=A0A1D1V5G3_RAMVA|nr:hypothetical protein RvY_06625 [Ramazzottius varieornatus]
MVTTTTKTLNYSITKGNQTNSVNATITSTPGFNSNYLGKIPGILKIVELILAAVALGLIASLRQEHRPLITTEGSLNPNPVPQHPWLSYMREQFLVGEVFFLCAHTAVITVLAIILISYLFHTTSAMIIPKATTLENVANLLLALMLLAAGILEIVMTVQWKYDSYSRQIMDNEGLRIAAGAIAILNGLLFIGSFVMSRKELAGPKTL